MVGGFEPSFSLKQRGRSSITSVIPFCLYYTILNRSCQRAYFIQFNLKNQMAVIWGLIGRFYPNNLPIVCASSALSSKSIEMCRESFLCKTRGTFYYAAVSGIIVDSGVLCTYSVSAVLSAFSAGTAVDSAICELELANGCIYLAAQYPS